MSAATMSVCRSPQPQDQRGCGGEIAEVAIAVASAATEDTLKVLPCCTPAAGASARKSRLMLSLLARAPRNDILRSRGRRNYRTDIPEAESSSLQYQHFTQLPRSKSP